ncbi:hypothetical protein B835_2580 [Enterococcus mundtii 3F]|nr:hypothetical protein [Enterococcus mundtii 3F]
MSVQQRKELGDPFIPSPFFFSLLEKASIFMILVFPFE